MSMKEGGEFDRRSIVLMKMIFKYRNFNRCFFGNDSDCIENKMGMIFAIFIRRWPGSAGFLWGMDEALAVQFRAAGKEKRATGARMATIRAEEGRAAVTRVAAPCVPGGAAHVARLAKRAFVARCAPRGGQGGGRHIRRRKIRVDGCSTQAIGARLRHRRATRTPRRAQTGSASGRRAKARGCVQRALRARIAVSRDARHASGAHHASHLTHHTATHMYLITT
ncbi:hypothetical protein [Burkholderia pseudomallei]|uniref:hypothetical protein n=2 Tax=Burkholderia pseudomallei TaxID=28450 RepID=UPI001E46372C|nr:hypothetical protein [Burkholderia pseudomallei]